MGVYPSTVYLDHQLIDTDKYIMDMHMHMHMHMHMYVDLLDEDTYSREMHFYVEPLKGPEMKNHEAQRQLSELSGVPAECIYYTAEGILFPVEISCLDIENKLDWYSISSDGSSLGLYVDGGVIYYKLKRIEKYISKHRHRRRY
ncbi:PREDICTED: ubiquitin carboxyl-terminal hydrolase 47-like [Amphimedon queenslandica]|uniref:Ubiquitin carboxyl-terminal hydrolase 47 C-terminal domain-containing protein n=1 Tax=Amphimedon queenslandica TaxID=400682 RepID=A0AAN0JNQ8_AMPQE|nr:PREDICTED: ubiquitin carboxyl-terminal hydrolase 47-like [Amphimedon queenslandica]|eukprot:XP_019858411.1 PREDICTED: ubiquitin carboxyl-terminal hydrolase 47-like [Amphimedon queenslandica]